MPAGPRAVLQGKKSIEQGKYAQAVLQLRTATSLLPTNAQAWNYLGLAYHYAGQIDEAERAYRRAQALDHDLTAAHYNLACLWLAQNKPEKTEAAKTELLSYTLRRGNSLEGLLKLGVAQLRARELPGAEKTFTDALRLNPQSPEALNGLGLARAQRGHPDEGVKCFQAALKQQQDFRPALLNMAILSQEFLRDRAAALKWYKQYAALKPPPPDLPSVQTVIRQLESELKPAPPPAAAPPPSSVAPTKPRAEITAPESNRVPAMATNTIVRAPPFTNPVTPFEASKGISTNPTPAFVPPKTLPASSPKPVVPNPPNPPNPASPIEVVTLRPEPILKSAEDVSKTEVMEHAPIEVARDNESSLMATATPTLTKPRTRNFFQRMNPLNLFRSEERAPPRPTPLPPVKEVPEARPLDLGLAPTQDALTVPSPITNTATARYLYLSPALPAAGNRSDAQSIFDQGVEAQKRQDLAEARKKYAQAREVDPSFFEAEYNLALTTAEGGDLAGALTAYERALAIRPESLDARYNFALALKKGGYFLDAVSELENLQARHPEEGRVNLALGNLFAQQVRQPGKARQCYLRVLEHDPHNAQASAIRYWLAANPQ